MTQTREAKTDVPEKAPDHPSNSTLRTGAFVGLFVLLVLLQLTTYRYCVDSPLNDAYLFNVARHTGWALNIIGHSATLESTGSPLNPVEARAFIAGAPSTVPPAQGDVDPPPLSAWERFQYRARANRQRAVPNTEFGPRLTYVFRPGLHQRIQALEQTRKAMEARNAPATELSPVETDIQSLQLDLNAGLADPELRKKQRGLSFTFIVIPTCGAIEIMAIFLAAVIAFPATWRGRAWGLLLGLPILYLINILRLACLAVIGAVDGGGPWFTFIHEYVWQALYVVFVVILWLAWVEMTVRKPRP